MPTIFRVRTNLVGGSGSSQVSTLYFSTTLGATAQDAADAVTQFWTDIKGKINTGYTMKVETEVYTIDLATGEPTSVEGVTSSLVTGTEATNPLPWATQGLIRWTTGTFLNGRQLLGHTYIPGPSEANNDTGTPRSDYQSTLTTAAGTLLGTAGVTLVAYSRRNHTAFPVIAGTTWDKWAVLRTRRD